MVDRKTEENIAQFCGVTGASVKEARRYLDKYKRLDVAIDVYFSNPSAMSASSPQPRASAPSTSKLNALFDKYKEPEEPNEIQVDGTIQLCADLGVDPEDIVLLALAHDLKSPRMGTWTRQGWLDGWKALGCDTMQAMADALPKLRDKLSKDAPYFKKVYSHTFNFARSEGQRSLPLDTAQAFWALLLPHGLQGGALSHVSEANDDEEDVKMGDADDPGWTPQHTDLWFEFLGVKGGKGVSKDTWNMFLDFLRTTDSKFENYDTEAAWPSTIDDFVSWAKEKLGTA